MPDDDLDDAEFQARIEATVGIAIVIVFQAALAAVSLERGWALAGLPGWVWLVPVAAELPLVALFALRGSTPTDARRRRDAIRLVGIINLANVLALGALMVSILEGREVKGASSCSREW